MATYKDTGVDLESAAAAFGKMGPYVQQTLTTGVVGKVGAFGGFYELPGGYNNPILVSSVDGVGTKLKVAFRANRHDSIGEDLVNHCVNDIAVCGAKPLYFLDYFATGKLDPGVFEAVIAGIARGCKANGCALIGGETAEMPDFYTGGEYDLAGTVVGIVEKVDILDGSRVTEGDSLVGIPSDGLHTNGYTLARYACFGTDSPYGIGDCPKELEGESVGEALLKVHRSYLQPIRALCEVGLANAFAHITGGGIEGNTRRVVQPPLTFAVHYDLWERPAIFNFIQGAAEVPETDMRQTFNLGIGLVAVVPQSNVEAALMLLRESGEDPVVIGRVSRL